MNNQDAPMIETDYSALQEGTKCYICGKLIENGDEIIQSFRGPVVYSEHDGQLVVIINKSSEYHVDCREMK